jgi:hypothetical protein
MIAAPVKLALTPAGKALRALLLAGCLLGGLYAFAYSSGRAGQLQDTVKAYEKRMGIYDDTNNLNRFELCLELGGMRDECPQLRGVDAAAQGQ